MALIDTKFDIGDAVYYTRPYWKVADRGVICPVCNGSSKFTTPSGREIACPGVSGYACIDGHIGSAYKNYLQPVSGVICEIFVCISDEGTDVEYTLKGSDDCYRMNDNLYASLKEAKDVCDRHNNRGANT